MGLLANLIFINGPISITDEESYDDASDGSVEWFDSPSNMLPVFWELLLAGADYSSVQFDVDYKRYYLTISKQKAVENLHDRIELVCATSPNWLEAMYLLFVTLISSIDAETVFVRGDLIDEMYADNPTPNFIGISDEQLAEHLSTYADTPHAGNCMIGDTWSYKP